MMRTALRGGEKITTEQYNCETKKGPNRKAGEDKNGIPPFY